MYVLKVWSKGEWWWLANVESEACVLTPRMQEAEKFKTELHAHASACYLPKDTMWRTQHVD